jgi:hypothetical protein
MTSQLVSEEAVAAGRELLNNGHCGNKVLVLNCCALGTTGRENRETEIGESDPEGASRIGFGWQWMGRSSES